MKTELNVFFKMMQKDDKKEVLKFEIKGNEDGEAENDLFVLSGSIIVFNIEGCAAGEVTAEFMNIQRDSKKTVMKFAIKGDSEDKAQQLYKYAGRNVKLSVQPSQMSIEEFYEAEHEGIEYTVGGDGVVTVDSDQLSMDEVAAAQEEKEEGAENVADLEQERQRRGRPKKEDQSAAEQAAPSDDVLPTADDDLPF